MRHISLIQPQHRPALDLLTHAWSRDLKYLQVKEELEKVHGITISEAFYTSVYHALDVEMIHDAKLFDT